MKIESNSAEETFALGKQCGEKAAAGQVYCLYGDLGVGKTGFTKGCMEKAAEMGNVSLVKYEDIIDAMTHQYR